jgi:hypothetical protein
VQVEFHLQTFSLVKYYSQIQILNENWAAIRFRISLRVYSKALLQSSSSCFILETSLRLSFPAVFAKVRRLYPLNLKLIFLLRAGQPRLHLLVRRSYTYPLERLGSIFGKIPHHPRLFLRQLTHSVRSCSSSSNGVFNLRSRHPSSVHKTVKEFKFQRSPFS